MNKQKGEPNNSHWSRFQMGLRHGWTQVYLQGGHLLPIIYFWGGTSGLRNIFLAQVINFDIYGKNCQSTLFDIYATFWEGKMLLSHKRTFVCLQLSRPGVDFIKVKLMAQIIEIALSIYALRLRPTFERLFTGVKVWHKGIKCKKVHEIDHRLMNNMIWYDMIWYDIHLVTNKTCR